MRSPQTGRGTHLAPVPRAASELSLRRWTGLCAAAEAIGMTAAAAAATAAAALTDGPRTGTQVGGAVALVLGAGLVEGVALGGLQAYGLRRPLPGLPVGRWVAATVLVAGLGWAAGAVPSVLSPAGGAAGPGLLVVVPGALAVGIALGAVLGAAQATALRGLVRFPWRWVTANAMAWGPAMVLLFLGATAPAETWSPLAVAATGTLTGAGAGTALGLLTGAWLPTLDGRALHSRAVLALLGSPAHRLLSGALVGLRLRGAVHGRIIELPVQYALDTGPDGVALVVLPGHPERKRWWRNLSTPAPVQVRLRGRQHLGRGRLLHPGDPGYDRARAAYQRRWPRVRPGDGPLVRVLLDEPGAVPRARPGRGARLQA